MVDQPIPSWTGTAGQERGGQDGRSAPAEDEHERAEELRGKALGVVGATWVITRSSPSGDWRLVGTLAIRGDG